MLKRFLVLFYLFAVVFPVFSATPTQSNSGSGTLGKPSVKFKEWQIGRSLKSSDSKNDNPKSFITSTGTACHFTASVGYDGNQGDSVSLIDPSTVSWTVINADPSSMALVTSETNWSGDSHPSKLDPSTSFNVVGTISVPVYTPTAKPDICKDENNHRRHERTPLHRGNKKLGFTLKFTAETEDGQEVEKELVLKADNIDQVRQEYVDLNRPIPKRGEFKSEDTYDFGHYEKMLNEGLSDWYQKWINQMNTDYRGNKAALTKSDFTLNSGYRNPHHNQHHAGSGGLSPHMYGYALDVAGKDLDGDDTLDRQDMVDAAYAIPRPNRARYSALYSDTTHVHADWAPNSPVLWKHRKKTAKDAETFSLPPQGTDSPVSASPAPAPTPPADSSNTDITYACGIHSGTSSASSSHSLQASCSADSNCISTSFYLCQHTSHTYGTQACGHSSGASGDHSLQASCTSTDSNGNSCTVSSFYACDGHTHSYPTTVSCSRSACTETVSSALEHRVGPCTACGGIYWSCGPYANWGQHYHRHRTCRFLTCRQTWRLCVDEKPDCLANSRQGQKCWSE